MRRAQNMLLSLAEHPVKEIYEVFAELSAQLQQKNRNPFLVNRVYDKTRKLMSNSIKTINRRTQAENC